MLKRFFLFSLALNLLFMPLAGAAFAAADSADAGIKAATTPRDCQGAESELPPNCVFLFEPIGGTIGYDLFVRECLPPKDSKKTTNCTYSLWRGEAVTGPNKEGPFQAILSYEPGKAEQRAFGLFYNYVGLIYRYLSGVIVAAVILFVVVGAVQMITSGGDQQAFDSGKSRIIHALVGMVIWFLASLILYTINPTFFAF